MRTTGQRCTTGTQCGATRRLQFLVVVAASVLVSASGVAVAQLRPGQPPVIDAPVPVAAPDPRPAIVDQFGQQYHASRRPRIALFWFTRYDDELQAVKKSVTTRRETGQDGSTSFTKSTAGPAGNATTVEREGSRKLDVTTEQYETSSNTAKVASPFSPRDSAGLRSAFVETMRQGGVVFVDRTSMVRRAAAQNRALDIKQAETQGLAEAADLVLEVVPVPDDRAPAGFAFAISVRSVRGAEELVSAYSLARPWMPRGSAHYAATGKGFELVAPPTPRATTHDFGIALALDVMQAMGPSLVIHAPRP